MNSSVNNRYKINHVMITNKYRLQFANMLFISNFLQFSLSYHQLQKCSRESSKLSA